MADKRVKAGETGARTSECDPMLVKDKDFNSFLGSQSPIEIIITSDIEEKPHADNSATDMDTNSCVSVYSEYPFISESQEDKAKSSVTTGTDDTLKVKHKKYKRKKGADEGHEVTFTVTISVAVPVVNDTDHSEVSEILKMKTRMVDSLSSQNYYHFEYAIFPHGNDHVKVDVVTFGMGSKIYLEQHEPMVKKMWRDGNVNWIAWSQKHKLYVTKNVLLKLHKHTFELRVWDTKDKVGVKAKFDRLKHLKPGPTVKQEDTDDMNAVKNMVLWQTKNYFNAQPKKAPKMRPLPREITCHKNQDHACHKKTDEENPVAASGNVPLGDHKHAVPTPHVVLAEPHGDTDLHASKHHGHVHHKDNPAGRHESHASTGKPRKSLCHSAKIYSELASISKSKDRIGIRSASAKGKDMHLFPHGASKPFCKPPKNDPAMQIAAENIKKYGIVMVAIRMSVLFAGLESVTSRLESPVPGLEDMFVTIQLNEPLLNEKQRLELNPMVLKIHSATNMPDTPLSYQQLSERCLPPFCKYTLFQLPPHVTMKRYHLSNIYWDDINVILIGTLEKSKLRQFLIGTLLEIEIHDRDRKPQDIQLKATLFGNDLEDDKISNVGTVASRRTLHNAFHDKLSVWDPYGVARVDLSELLLGHRYLHMKIPVHNCPLPDMLGNDVAMGRKLIGLSGAVDGPVDSPMPIGHYMSSDTMLKIKVELAHPLVQLESVTKREHIETTIECPYSRIVYKFAFNNAQMVDQLQTLVTKINAHALKLDDMPQHVINAALSTYKLSWMQQQDHTLDIVTGFHLLDGTMHLFVLEGLREAGIKEFWHALPPPEMADVSVLFHSNLSFNQRLYGPLDVDLCLVKLHEPLSEIVQQPLLYVRDMVPKPCFQALVKLHEMSKMKNMRDVVRNELFPTAEMVATMNREFGVPFTVEDFDDLHLKDEKSFLPKAPTCVPETTTSVVEDPAVQDTNYLRQPIGDLNVLYLEKLLDRQKQRKQKDFIKEHIEKLRITSNSNKKARGMKRPMTVKVDMDVVHNYSAQTLNSTELAKEQLRQMLAKDPKTMYTYNQDYHHSMTFVPINLEAIKKKEKLDGEVLWQSKDGWINAGMRSSREDNAHSSQPHQSRSEDLKETWVENSNDALKSPLNRDRYPWEFRNRDFELYKRPLVNFGQPEPHTIHLAGEMLHQERLAKELMEQEQWKSKVVVSDIRQYFHRCLTETEFHTGGWKASNQMAKLQGILKDQCHKFSLQKAGMALDKIPALNIVRYPSVDIDARLTGVVSKPSTKNKDKEQNAFKPGGDLDHSWVLDRNHILATDYEHGKFKKLKGHDFNAYHKEKSKMSRRIIVPLTDEERDSYVFQFLDNTKKFHVLPEFSLGNSSMMQLPQVSAIGVMQSRTNT